MSQYISETSDALDPAYKQFFESFYKISDHPEGHEEYAQQFTPEGTLVMASKTAQGTDEIIKMRHAMWDKVATRSHSPHRIFAFSSTSNEVMLYGTVVYTLKAGGQSTVPWAARAVMAKDGGTVRMSYYQVYLDTAAQQQSK